MSSVTTFSIGVTSTSDLNSCSIFCTSLFMPAFLMHCNGFCKNTPLSVFTRNRATYSHPGSMRQFETTRQSSVRPCNLCTVLAFATSMLASSIVIVFGSMVALQMGQLFDFLFHLVMQLLQNLCEQLGKMQQFAPQGSKQMGQSGSLRASKKQLRKFQGLLSN